MDRFLIDVAGWLGVVMVLAAYALVSARRIEGDALLYQALNIVGAALLIVNSFYYHAYPSVGVNIVWIGIGAYTLLRQKK